jgi:hypothetical protein
VAIANFPDGLLPGPIAGSPIVGPPEGLIWYNSTQKALQERSAVGTAGLVGLLKASTSDSTISATNTETAFTDGFFLLPANSLTVGKSFRISFGGVYTSAATPGTIRFNWRYGSVAGSSPNICSTNNMTMTASQNNTVWGAWMVMTVRTIGASGSALGSGAIQLGNSTGNPGVGFGASTASAATIDTTVATFMTLFCAFSLTTASITMTTFTFEALN